MRFEIDIPSHAVSIDAPAKINLCLQICGMRADGYHDLVSVVGFSAFGDRLEIAPSSRDSLHIKGNFAPSLTQDASPNSLTHAIDLLRSFFSFPPLSIYLDKRMPIAGGLGGGSSDAAALLRFMYLRSAKTPAIEACLHQIACQLGADVPVCMRPGFQLMRGTGIVTTPLATSAHRGLYCILANPGLACPTSAIFARVKQVSISKEQQAMRALRYGSFGALFAIGNDLQPLACALMPEISALVSEMSSFDKRIYGAAMSGSGSSCFALTRDRRIARLLCYHLRVLGYWSVFTRFIHSCA